jgi:hypothetical protein
VLERKREGSPIGINRLFILFIEKEARERGFEVGERERAKE